MQTNQFDGLDGKKDIPPPADFFTECNVATM